MQYDDLDALIRDALAEERRAAGRRLAGLEARVAASLAGRPPKGSWRHLLSRVLPANRASRFALVGSLVVACVVGFLLGRALPLEMEPLLSGGGTLFAVVAPQASSVAVVGEFSGWQPVPLADAGSRGVWTAVLPLPPGRYEYAFVVDGRWIGQDPLADEYVRSFGEYASVRYVQEEA